MKPIPWLLRLLVLVLSVPVQAQEATLVFTGAREWTGDPGRPWAEAVAIRDDEVLAVGDCSTAIPSRSSRGSSWTWRW